MNVKEAARTMGKVGGPARAASLSPKRRSEIASEGAKAANAKKRELSKKCRYSQPYSITIAVTEAEHLPTSYEVRDALQGFMVERGILELEVRVTRF